MCQACTESSVLGMKTKRSLTRKLGICVDLELSTVNSVGNGNRLAVLSYTQAPVREVKARPTPPGWKLPASPAVF